MAVESIDVPDDLALRLESVKDRLVEILESGYQVVVDDQIKIQEEVVNFLAGGPTPEEIVAFRPSPSSMEKVSVLLDKNRQGILSPQEEAELDQVEALDHLTIRVKARARALLQHKIMAEAT